jgi:hypothetical protein
MQLSPELLKHRPKKLDSSQYISKGLEIREDEEKDDSDEELGLNERKHSV